MLRFLILLALATSALAGTCYLIAPTIRDSARVAIQVHEAGATAQVIHGLGYVEPVSEMRRLAFQVDGVIASCPVRVGQHVRRGETMICLRNGDQSAAVTVAQKRLLLAEAERNHVLAGVQPEEIEAAQRQTDVHLEQMRHAQTQLARLEKLATVASKSDLEKWETEAAQAKLRGRQSESDVARLKNAVRGVDRELAEAKVELARAELVAADVALANTTILAPFDGTVLEILKREGEATTSGLEREPVLMFADDTRLQVRAEIDERHVAEIQVGQEAFVYARGLGGQRYSGKVILVKGVMGKKTVFARDATERKDLDVVQIFIELPSGFRAPFGLEVEVEIVKADSSALERVADRSETPDQHGGDNERLTSNIGR